MVLYARAALSHDITMGNNNVIRSTCTECLFTLARMYRATANHVNSGGPPNTGGGPPASLKSSSSSQPTAFSATMLPKPQYEMISKTSLGSFDHFITTVL